MEAPLSAHVEPCVIDDRICCNSVIALSEAILKECDAPNPNSASPSVSGSLIAHTTKPACESSNNKSPFLLRSTVNSSNNESNVPLCLLSSVRGLV